jgi:hypothetical protein
MKYLIYLIVFSLTSCKIERFKCDKFSNRIKTDNEWTEFSDWQQVDFDVQLKKRFLWVIPTKMVIYDKKKLVYKMNQLIKSDTTESGEDYLSYESKDKEGLKCIVVFINKGESVYTVICYDDINYCYNIK